MIVITQIKVSLLIPEDGKISLDVWKLIKDFPDSSRQDSYGICPKLNPVNNGMMNSSEHSLGTSVIFSCAEGHEMIGNEIVNCVNDGQSSIWNGLPPKCYDKEKYLVSLLPGHSDQVMNQHNSNMIITVIGSTVGVAIALLIAVILIWSFINYKKRKPNRPLSDLSTPLFTTEGDALNPV